METRIAAIYDFIFQRTPTVVLPGLWSRFSAPDGIFHPPSDASHLADELLTTFSQPDLVESGVMRPEDSSHLAIHPALSNPGSLLFALRDESSKIYSILCDSGCLNYTQWPFYQMMQDVRTREQLVTNDGKLFVTFSVSDVATFRAMGMPAVLGSGLDQIDDDQLSDFLHAAEIDLTRRKAAKYAKPVGNSLPSGCKNIVLVGWSPTRFDETGLEAAEKVERQLQHLGRTIDLPLEKFFIWKLASNQLLRLSLAVRQVDKIEVCRELFADYLLDYSYVVDTYEELSVQSKDAETPAAEEGEDQLSYFEAHARFAEMQLNVSNAGYRAEVEADALSSYYTEVIGPLIRTAEKNRNGVERAILFNVADASWLLKQATVELNRECSTRAVKSQASGNSRSDLFKRWGTLAKAVQDSIVVYQNLRSKGQPSGNSKPLDSHSRRCSESQGESAPRQPDGAAGVEPNPMDGG